MIRKWQLRESKNRLSAVVNEALAGAPQIITRHGEEVVVVLSVQNYRKLVSPTNILSQFFAESPLVEAELDLKRDATPPREPIDP